MKYKNGFYVYRPDKSKELGVAIGGINALMVTQVIQVIEGIVWLTGMANEYPVKQVEFYGTIGKMVLTEDGDETK